MTFAAHNAPNMHRLSYYTVGVTAVVEKRWEIHCCRQRWYLLLQKMSDVLHIAIVQGRHRFVWICKNFLCFSSLLCAQRYFCLASVVKKVTCDAPITSGMTVRSLNDSVLTEHIEIITFSEVYQYMHCSMLAGKPESSFRMHLQIQSLATLVPVIFFIKSNLWIKSFRKSCGTHAHFTNYCMNKWVVVIS
jgi:hypothetical protein